MIASEPVEMRTFCLGDDGHEVRMQGLTIATSSQDECLLATAAGCNVCLLPGRSRILLLGVHYVLPSNKEEVLGT